MHDGKSCDVGQISIYSPQIKGTYAAISATEDVTEDTGQNSQLYNSAMSPRYNKGEVRSGLQIKLVHLAKVLCSRLLFSLCSVVLNQKDKIQLELPLYNCWQ